MKKILFAVLLTATSLFADQPECLPFKLHNVEGYWESWSPMSEPEEIAQMSPNVMNIAFAHYVPTPCGNKLVPFFGSKERGKRFIEMAHNFGKDVKLSVIFGSKRIGAKLDTPQDIEEITHSIAKLVKDMRLDGVDLCFLEHVDANLQIALIEKLRTALGTYSLISYTSKAISAIPTSCDEVLAKTHTLLNSMTIPAFDLGEAYQYEGTVERLISLNIPPEKITIGLFPGLDKSGKMTYLSDIEKTAFYVRYKNLGGIAIWSLNRDYENQHGFGSSAVTNKLAELFLNPPFTILPVEDYKN